jgi:ABC-type methionine transport system ATPase subunit
MLGIEHILDRRPGGLSGGEKQRIAIGRALLMKPRLLLFDDATRTRVSGTLLLPLLTSILLISAVKIWRDE